MRRALTAVERRWRMFRPTEVPRKDKNRLCLVCRLYIHKDMESCQPCHGSIPEGSQLHKFDQKELNAFAKQRLLTFEKVKGPTVRQLRKRVNELESQLSIINQKLNEARQQLNRTEVEKHRYARWVQRGI